MKIKKSHLLDIISILFMILFLYASISKLLEYTVFKEQLAESPVLAKVAPMLAFILPTTEIITVIALLLPRWRLRGLYAALTLMVMFSIYIIAILSFSNQLPCSCGGVLSELSWPQHIIFNGVFIALGVAGVILEKQSGKVKTLDQNVQAT